MKNGTEKRRFNPCPGDDRQELRNRETNGRWKAKQSKCYKGSGNNCGEQEAINPKEQESVIEVNECDKKCQPTDRKEGMFGYICLRCKYDDLGSLTEY